MIFFTARKFLVAGGLAIGLAAGAMASPEGARAQSGQPAAAESPAPEPPASEPPAPENPALPQAQPDPKPTAQSAPPPSVTAATAERHEMIGRVPVSGTLVARREILVYPQVSGYTIDSIAVDEGDFVSEGDVLAQLNDTTLQAQYAQAQAEAARAQAAVSQASSQIASADASKTQADAALSRTSRLRASGNVSQATLDDAQAKAQTAAAAAQSARDGLAVAQAQMQQAQAQLRIAQLNLDHATLLAPASGLISQRNGQIGAIAASGGEPIFRLIQDGVVEVRSEVIETALAQISDGDPAQIDIAGIGRVNGKVRLIAPTVDPVNRLGTVLISLESTDSLRSGCSRAAGSSPTGATA
ncbi:efflux RND transporter periplasmic adaptor subunit [Brevirhabdus sp.]|uniref:efflux RND transporter periplasmic adaptor subunit n=1 Tax=Brevirhabdus sp. TaxID=2004514 RepID=UPI004059A06F